MHATPKAGSYVGEFWLPHHPDAKIGGMLKVGPEGFAVELLGYVGTSPEILLGSVQGLGGVTLCGCFATRTSAPEDHPYPTKDRWSAYRASYLFIGCHLPRGFETPFVEVEVELPHLDVWADITGLRLVDPDTGFSREPLTICRAQTDEFDCVLFNYVGSSGDVNNLRRSETHVSVSKFVLSRNEPVPVSVLHDIAHRLRDFLSLMLGAPCDIHGLRFNNPKEYDDHGFVRSNSARLCVSQDYEARPVTDLLFHQLMPLEELGGRFGEILTQWLHIADELRMQVWLYFSGTYDLRRYSPYWELRLVALIQALESIHRQLIGGYREDPKTWQERRESVVEASPAEHKEWAAKSLEGSNNKDLRQRLRELFDRARPVDDLLVQKQKRKGFIHKCVLTRNYFSHYDESRAEGRFAEHEHYAAILILSMLLESLLFLELGFDAKHIRERVRESKKYQDLMFQRNRYDLTF